MKIVTVNLIKDKSVHPFLWHDNCSIFAEKLPKWRKWIYHPKLNTLIIGDCTQHLHLIPEKSKHQDIMFWLRGFFFPHKKMVAMRPFTNGHIDNWSLKAIEKNTKIQTIVADWMRSQNGLTFNVKFVFDVDNRWLNKNIEIRSW